MGGSQAGVRYQVAIERQAKRSLERRINADIVEKIIETIDRLEKQPYLGKPVKGQLKGKYRLTVRRDCTRVGFSLSTVLDPTTVPDRLPGFIGRVNRVHCRCTSVGQPKLPLVFRGGCVPKCGGDDDRPAVRRFAAKRSVLLLYVQDLPKRCAEFHQHVERL